MIHNTRVSAIAIISKNRGLGKDNHLLFHIPGELPRLKALTMRHPLIMGRKTHESIGRVLPGRLNIVITRNSGKDIPGSLVFVDSLDKALEIAKGSEEERIKNSSPSEQSESRSLQDDKNSSRLRSNKNTHNSKFIIHNSNENEVFILGGGQIFTEALPLTDRLYLTIVDHIVPADTFFPDYAKEFAKVITKEEKNDWEYAYRFVTLERSV